MVSGEICNWGLKRLVQTEMEGSLASHMPGMDWSSSDLPAAWKSLQQNAWKLSSEESKKLSSKAIIFLLAINHTHIIQQEKEPLEQFLTTLKIDVNDCGHKDPDEIVRDRVVIGCYSQKVREKLIKEGSELTLEKAVDIARMQELSNMQL